MSSLTSATAVVRTSLTTRDGTSWTVRPGSAIAEGVEGLTQALPAEISAEVPGEVHTDLLRAGLIEDPFDGLNEPALAWIGNTDWVWRATVDWDEDSRTEDHHDLVISGLDTVARVLVNGVEVGSAANQHRSHRFDVTSALRHGTNDVEIAVTGPYPAARRAEERLGARPKAYRHPFNALRKMASAYGWDWGPDLAGAGILGDIAVESWTGVRVSGVGAHARWDDAAELSVDVSLDWSTARQAHLELRCAGASVTGDVTASHPDVSADSDVAHLRLAVPQAEAWWPRGHGAQPLYDVELLLDGASVWSGRVGFRTVSLSTVADAAGAEFQLSVNGRGIYVRGANWIPADALMSRVTTDTYRERIADAVAAGMNLLRVWGGGIYESEAFYDACDEAGILVWQDFLFACAAYSEDPPLREEVEAEAREAIVRLSPHPSLALWNGNNENIWGYVDWGWAEQLGDRSWGDGYYTDLLPSLVAELAPGTPYSPGSPYSFGSYRYPNDPRFGSMHIWDVWNARDYAVYRHYRPRFVSEFGFQGPAAWSTLMSVVHDQPLAPHSPQLLNHQKAHDGNLKLARGLGDHLPSWREHDGVVDMDDWHWITSLNQARAVAFGITHFRSLAPHNTGAVVWQLNDNWPVISWAAVDAHGIRKPLWFALRDVYADRFAAVVDRPLALHPFVDLCGADPGPGVQTLVLHNDTDETWTESLVISRREVRAGSTVLARQDVEVSVPARTRIDVALDEAVRTPADAGAELIEVRAGEHTLTHGWFVEDTALRLVRPDQAYTVSARAVPGGHQLTVTAAAVVKDLTLFCDRLDPAARVDSALITLVAGQSHTFTVRSEADLDHQALGRRPVLRSVNDLVNDLLDD